MRTVKRNPFLSGTCAILGGAFLMGGVASVGPARADVTSDRAAAILVFPKLVFDSSTGTDTVIQLSNTSDTPVHVLCFYVNANSHCSNDPEQVCNTNADCGLGICVPGWNETDFRFTLTARQPIQWRISSGLGGNCVAGVGDCFPLDGVIQIGPGGQFNEDSRIPVVPEDPFFGELKCIQVAEDEAPTDENSLKGEATIIVAASGDTDAPDARGYNAIGIQAIAGQNDGDNTLELGSEYNGCPNILILDHFFDDAIEPIDGASVRTDLTLTPCSQNFELQSTFDTTVQFLVYNEFEQRFSASTRVRCLREIPLSDIDTAQRSLTDNLATSTGDTRSIFNVNVQGTLTGQTRIRGVDDGSPEHGNGLLAIAEEFHRTSPTLLNTVRASAAFNVHQVGVRATPDIITIP